MRAAVVLVVLGACGGQSKDAVSDGGIDGAIVDPSPAVLAVAPAPVDFGMAALDAAATRKVTVSNSGGPSGSIFAHFEGADADAFYIDVNQCAALARSGTCDITLLFKPRGLGPKVAKLVVSDGTDTVTVDVGGNGLASAALTIDTTGYTFTIPTVLGATSQEQKTFTITNQGSVATGTLGGTASGANATEFPVDDGCTGQILQPNGTCTMTVRFKPVAPRGTKAMAFTMSAMPGGTTGASVTAQALAPAQLSIAPASFDFGFAPGGYARQQVFVVSNLGDVASGPVGMSIPGGGGGGAFTIPTGSDGCHQKVLAPTGMAGNTCSLIAVYLPMPGVTAALTATLTANASPGGTGTSMLAGTATSNNANLSITPNPGDYGAVSVGSAKPLTFTVQNLDSATTGPLTTSIRRINANDNDFKITTDNCANTTLAANATCTIDITFAPAGTLSNPNRAVGLSVYSQVPVNWGVDTLQGLGN